MNVVTKSGTNELPGSAFECFRDKSLNAQDRDRADRPTRRRATTAAPVRRQLGGPIVRDRTHFFLAIERIQQDTTQAVDTEGSSPTRRASSPRPTARTWRWRRCTQQINPRQYLTVRYGFNNNSQPYGASPARRPSQLGRRARTSSTPSTRTSTRSLGGGEAQRVRVPVLVFPQPHRRELDPPHGDVPQRRLRSGRASNTPQTTDQRKYQFRDDLTWNRGRHEFKTGVSFIYEPVLDITFNSGQAPNFEHLEDSRTSPISSITMSGLIPGQGGS